MGTLLCAASATMATEAVLVRAPPQQPRLMAGSKRKMYLPIRGANNMGRAVANTPQKNSPAPAFFTPAIKVGPAVMPTMAIKVFRPTEFMNHRVALGTLPRLGLKLRNQPKTIPANNAPPEVDRVMGTPLMGTVMAPKIPTRAIPKPTKTMSVTLVGRSDRK